MPLCPLAVHARHTQQLPRPAAVTLQQPDQPHVPAAGLHRHPAPLPTAEPAAAILERPDGNVTASADVDLELGLGSTILDPVAPDFQLQHVPPPPQPIAPLAQGTEALPQRAEVVALKQLDSQYADIRHLAAADPRLAVLANDTLRQLHSRLLSARTEQRVWSNAASLKGEVLTCTSVGEACWVSVSIGQSAQTCTVAAP